MCSTFARFCAVLGIALLVEACSLAPKYERPDQDLPASWKSVKLESRHLQMDWWTRFNDPVLNGLVKDALARNQDLAESMAKVESAAAQAGVGSAALWPQTSAGGEATGSLASEKSANVTPFNKSGLSRSTTSYQGTLSAAWELDFWGKYRDNYTALTNILLKTAISHEALRLSIAGQVCQSYFKMLSCEMQLQIAKRTLRTREDGLRIYQVRYKQGDITELDYQRAVAEVESARSQVHSSTMALDRAEASLAVLTGRSPKEIVEAAMPRGASISSLPAVPVIPAGLPSELLERRPDIRAAEYALIASNAQIGAARAQFFPSISLTGITGTLAAAVANLFTGPAAMFSYGASISLPLLDGGSNWYNLKDAEAQKKQAIAVYRKTVQSAFEDVRTSLTSQRECEGVVKAAKAQMDSLRRAAELARMQYDTGYTDYLTVLDAERSLFSAELAYANALQNRLSAIVSVCMALGGGWQDPHDKVPFFGPDAQKLIERQERGLAPAAANPQIR